MPSLHFSHVASRISEVCGTNSGGKTLSGQCGVAPLEREAQLKWLLNRQASAPDFQALTARPRNARGLSLSPEPSVTLQCRASGHDRAGPSNTLETLTTIKQGSSKVGSSSVVVRAQATEVQSAGREAEEEERRTSDESTLCILSGEMVDDPEKEAQEMQEKIIRQLTLAQVIFPALAVSRAIDGLPGLMDPSANKLEELMTVVSAVDPLLVGIFAYGTATGLQKILDKEKCKEETLENMRRKAMDSLVNFFERANLVVFGVALATFSKLAIEYASDSEWSGQLMEAGDRVVELQEVISAVFEIGQ